MAEVMCFIPSACLSVILVSQDLFLSSLCYLILCKEVEELLLVICEQYDQ